MTISRTKVFRGATLIDGVGNIPVVNSEVVINDDLIVKCGNERAADSISAGKLFDITGMTILPGLIDCHLHAAFSFQHQRQLNQQNKPMSYRHLETAQFLNRLLQAGYTTIRDGCGLDVGFKWAIEDGLISGPRVLLSLFILSPPGGIGETIGNLGLKSVTDEYLPITIARGADELKLAVGKLVAAGADVIKFAATGASSISSKYGSKDQAFTAKEIETIITEAHKFGKKTMCHAIGGPGLRAAIEAGVDSIEHGFYLDEDPELVELMAKKDIFYVPTFSVGNIRLENNLLDGQARAQRLALHQHRDQSFKLALAAGVNIVAGSDIFIGFTNKFAAELQYMVDESMSPMQTITASTSLAACCLGIEQQTGSIQLGKQADLLVVDGNPLEDITILQNPQRIKLVIKAGKIFVNNL